MQNFQQGVLLDPWIKQARRYVLSLLIRDDRQKHFRDKKFPQTFAMVTEEIKNLTKIVLSVVRQKFPLCELEEFNKYDSIIRKISRFIRKFASFSVVL